MLTSRKTKKIKVGNLFIGGDAPISVQSMTKTKTENIEATVAQIQRLQQAGCELIRVAVPTEEAAAAISKIKKQTSLPIIADIHYRYELALAAIRAGADKIRINPGNLTDKLHLKAIIKEAKRYQIPIRIGVNAGSLQHQLLQKHNGPTAEALSESALNTIKYFEALGFYDIIVSVKAFDVPTTVEAYKIISAQTNYPLHIGITEAGLSYQGIIRNAIGIGALLLQGIGDTLRVSLTTSDPCEEVVAGFEILKALGIRENSPIIISCPSCGRCEVDLVKLTEVVQQKVEELALKHPYKIAVMGCVVNGPLEAKYADIGLACGKGCGELFKLGKPLKRIKESEFVEALIEELKAMEGII